jgi:dTDP-4-dehydrorhamnose reductase
MRILIFGASGMLGHKLHQELGRRHDVFGTLRTDFSQVERYGVFDRSRVIENVDAADRESVADAIRQAEPDCVINAIGVIKQVPVAHNPEKMLALNAVFPRELARLTSEIGCRLITISTDCVFSGARGGYIEADVPDARDLYGMSKLLGEIDAPNALTLRTSIVGRELGTAHSIVEWFLAHRGGAVRGFTKAMYSGFSTIEAARLIERIIVEHKELTGVYHMSSDPISKFELLGLLNDAFSVNVRIEPSDELVIDRTLNSSHFREATGYVPPGWPSMVQEMAADPTPYDSF